MVGCGSIAQIAHLPNLVRLSHLFELVGVADPSPSVSGWTAERFRTRGFGDHSELIEAGAEALVVASPHAAHAQVLDDAITQRIHVLVEKPLCVASQDARTVAARAEQQATVVQVGYMKRHDDAFAALSEDLASADVTLLSIRAATVEGADLHRSFQPAGMPTATDATQAQRAQWRESEREQMRAAVGTDEEDDIAVYRGLFLADFVHDLNLAHGVLAAMDVRPGSEHTARWWNQGRAGFLRFSTSSHVACSIDYVQIPGRTEYDEEFIVVTDRAVHRLRFPAPYLERAPTLYERRSQTDTAVTVRAFRSLREPFATELERFHASVFDGAPCLTPAGDAVADLVSLERCFQAGRREMLELGERR